MEPWRIQFDVKGEILIVPPAQPSVIVGGVIVFKTLKGEQMGEITVNADETTLRATVTLLDSEGNVTTPDEVPTWEVGDDTVLTCHPAADGMSASFDVGSPGASSVKVTAQETHGGVGTPTPVILTGLVTVVAGDVVSGSVEFATG
jgi:hypothetical protein